jgi:hypothetical protein
MISLTVYIQHANYYRTETIITAIILPIHSSIVLRPFVWPWPLAQFHNRFYTDGRTAWTSDQPVPRPLPTHRTTQPQTHTHRHPCLEWDSNPRSQRSSEQRKFMP